MGSFSMKEIRTDGRFPNELRAIKIEFGCLESKGFVLYSQGCTTIRTTICKAKDKKQLTINLNFLQTSRSEPVKDKKIYEIKQKINSIFAPLIPNESQIELNIEVLQDNGSLFSVIVNSISLALSYCGINTTDMCVSLTLNNCVDLCSAEEKGNTVICVVLLPIRNEILYFESFGKLQKGELHNALDIAKEQCENLLIKFKEELSSIVI